MNKTRIQLLEQALNQLGYIARTISAPHGFSLDDIVLTRPQIHIFFFVAHHKDGVSVKDIAQFLSVTKGAVSQFINVLVEKNLVKREEDTKDRRLQRITLTEFAESRLKQFEKSYYASLFQLFDDLTDEELQQLILLLNRVKSTIDFNSC
jgi:DNA-binding MarR family transcriptional regulator